MQCTIVGTRRVAMDKEDVYGYTCFVEHDEEGVTGKMAEKCFVRDSWISEHLEGVVPSVGETYEYQFSRNGKMLLDKLVS